MSLSLDSPDRIDPPTVQARWRRLRASARLAWRSLQTWPWLDTLRTLRLRFREDRLGMAASSLTFTTLIALVPLATLLDLTLLFPEEAPSRYRMALRNGASV